MTGCYSLKGALQCIGGYLVKMSLPVVYFAHLTMFYVYGLFFEDGFHLVLLFLLPGISELSEWSGNSKHRDKFSLNSGS